MTPMYLMETAAVMALTAVLVVALFAFLHVRSASRRKQMDGLAARQGWQVTRTLGQLGTRAQTTIRPTDPTDSDLWQVTIRVIADTNDKAPQKSVTEFTATEAKARSGTVVVGPPLPPGTAGMAAAMMQALDSPLGQQFLTAMTGPLDVDLAGLAQVQNRHGFPGTVFAAPGADEGLPWDDLVVVISRWKQRHAGESLHPIIIVAPHRLMVRVREDLADPALLEPFIAMALDIRGALRTPI
jgi:hypothetical protein